MSKPIGILVEGSYFEYAPDSPCRALLWEAHKGLHKSPQLMELGAALTYHTDPCGESSVKALEVFHKRQWKAACFAYRQEAKITFIAPDISPTKFGIALTKALTPIQATLEGI